MHKKWTVAVPGELWVSHDGLWSVNYVSLSRWRLTEVVRIKAFLGVRLVVMEHDRDFKVPQEATLHVSRLIGIRQREAKVPCDRGGIIGHGGRPRKVV